MKKRVDPNQLASDADLDPHCEFIVSAFDSLPTECRLPITFANRLDPEQVRQNVGPDLDSICLPLRWYS